MIKEWPKVLTERKKSEFSFDQFELEFESMGHLSGEGVQWRMGNAGLRQSIAAIQTQAYSFYCALLYRHCVFYKLKVCGNPVSSKSVRAIFPTDSGWVAFLSSDMYIAFLDIILPHT